MSDYIDESNIQATMSPARWTELSDDEEAVTFAINQANEETKGIISKTWDDLASVPDIIKNNAALIGRYWLYNYHELIDDSGSIYADCKDARKILQDIADGKKSGLEDGADATDNPVRWSSRERRFDLGDVIISGDDDE